MKPIELVNQLKSKGVIIIRPSGNSMTPLIQSKQQVTITTNESEYKKGDIVFAKVKGRYYIHLISAIQNERYQISNNHGHVNGWTTKDKIFGKVTKIEN
jgi:phage repressor protein C with HTH and peptisase S24 domain